MFYKELTERTRLISFILGVKVIYYYRGRALLSYYLLLFVFFNQIFLPSHILLLLVRLLLPKLFPLKKQKICTTYAKFILFLASESIMID